MKTYSDDRRRPRTAGPRSRVVHAEAVERARATALDAEKALVLADIFGLLGDANRLRLLLALLEAGEMCVGDLAAVTDHSESAASHALRLLRAHRVVAVRRSGRLAYYRLADDHVRLLLELAVEHVRHPASAEHGARS